MKNATLHTVFRARPAQKEVTIDQGLRLRIRTLVDERARLEEEVRQLRAAVQIYAEVVRRLESNGSEPLRAA